MYFLQTIRSDIKPAVLLRQLRQLDRFFITRPIDVEDADVEQYVAGHSGLHENHSEMSSEQLIGKMLDIRRTVMDLSGKLCSTGVMPVILKDLLVENPIDTKHPLMNFVYSREMFTPIVSNCNNRLYLRARDTCVIFLRDNLYTLKIISNYFISILISQLL